MRVACRSWTGRGESPPELLEGQEACPHLSPGRCAKLLAGAGRQDIRAAAARWLVRQPQKLVQRDCHRPLGGKRPRQGPKEVKYA